MRSFFQSSPGWEESKTKEQTLRQVNLTLSHKCILLFFVDLAFFVHSLIKISSEGIIDCRSGNESSQDEK